MIPDQPLFPPATHPTQPLSPATMLPPTPISPPSFGNINPQEMFSRYKDFADRYPELDRNIKKSIVEAAMRESQRHRERMRQLSREGRQHP